MEKANNRCAKVGIQNELRYQVILNNYTDCFCIKNKYIIMEISSSVSCSLIQGNQSTCQKKKNASVCLAAMKSLALCNSKQANKEKQLAGARVRDSRPGVLPGDLFDRAPDNFLAESQSVLSTNWACVSAGEIKRPQLPTEMSSPGPAVTHKSKAPGLRPGRLDTQPTSTQTQSAVCRATMIRLANVSPEKKKKKNACSWRLNRTRSPLDAAAIIQMAPDAAGCCVRVFAQL